MRKRVAMVCLLLQGCVSTVIDPRLPDRHKNVVVSRGSWSSTDGLYDRVDHIRPWLFIDTWNKEGGGSEFQGCGEAIKGSARDAYDFRALAEPFADSMNQALTAQGLKLNRRSRNAESHSPIALSFSWTIIDSTRARSGGFDPTPCQVIFDATIEADAETTFPQLGATFSHLPVRLYEYHEIAYTSPTYLDETLRESITEQVALIAPTLAHKTREGCGYFRKDPEHQCLMLRQLVLAGLLEDLKEAKCRSARDRIQKQIDEMKKKYPNLEPAESITRFTLTFPDDGPVPETRCAPGDEL